MVRPCFFHRSFGNIYEQSLEPILNSPEMISFRKNLDVQQDPTCRACVLPSISAAAPPPEPAMSERQQVAVLGLGRFGAAVARELTLLGHDQLAPRPKLTVVGATRAAPARRR